MTNGVTYRNWNGKPVLTQANEARVVLEPGGGWIGADTDDGDDFLTGSRGSASISKGHFADLLADWELPDLEGCYQRRDPNRSYDSYAKARFWGAPLTRYCC